VGGIDGSCRPRRARRSRATALAADWPARIARVCQDPTSVQVALQPIVDLSRGSVAGYEALARLPGQDGPEPWFTAAASHGLADLFEAAVLSRTLATRSELPPNAFVRSP